MGRTEARRQPLETRARLRPLRERLRHRESRRIQAAPSRNGRERFGLVGWLDDAIVVVTIVSPLGTEAMAIVSMRHASNAERERYGF